MARFVRTTIAVIVAAAAITPASAGAHAAFQDANPEPGSRLGSSPPAITLAFTEALNRELTTAKLVNARSGKAAAADVRVESGNRLLVRPRQALPTAAYRVQWHTVSVLDGHALEGSFGFGVRTNAVGGAQQLEQSPLARGGWLRVALRSVWYVALFFFGGGLLTAVMLRSPRGPGGWLTVGDESSAAATADRAWARTRTAGWIAAAAGVAVALAETRDAARSISWHAIDAYLLGTQAGGARALAAAGVLVAAALAGRAWRLAAVCYLFVLAAVAVGGHANSASPRGLALVSDWLHLAAASAWAGGIAQIGATWLPAIGRMSLGERRRVMQRVLNRFGGLALPAFAIVVVAGVVNALNELGRVSELWSSAYGRVLMVKIALVGVIATASYLHAMRLRPRLLAAPSSDARMERRHWQLLRIEPVLAAPVLAAAALLAVFPLPPHQLLERAEVGDAAVVPSPLRPPRADELAVAGEAGPWIAAASVKPVSDSASGTVRLLNFNLHPVRARIDVVGARSASCGAGCATFRLPSASRTVKVVARLGTRTHSAVLPISWEPQSTPAARRILRAAVIAVNGLHSFRVDERLASGLGGGLAVTHYRIAGRHTFAATARNAGQSQTVEIGRRLWTREPHRSWQVQKLDPPIDTREIIPWWTHRTAVRLLGIRSARGRRVADIALADLPRPGSQAPPFWFRLRIDLRSYRLLGTRMVAPGHFMTQRYSGFGRVERIRAPAGG